MLAQGQLNRKCAKALCTVITIGHLCIDNKESPLLYEPGETSQDEHIILMENIGRTGIEGLVGILPDAYEQIQKSEHPFIYACPNGVGEDKANQNEIDESLRHYTDGIEQYFSGLFGGEHRGFYGAYIGGIAQRGRVDLYCPSLLRQYPTPNYLGDILGFRDEWREKYYESLKTTETILDIFAHIRRHEAVGGGIHYPDPRKSRLLINDMPVELQEGNIFGSVHGLVTSMTKNFQNNHVIYNVELALSASTNKTASCVPCAIFARSQNATASYTHLGRGDFWSLPEEVDDNMRNAWENYVNQCYQVGMEIFGEHLKALSDEYENFFNALEDYSIPNAFLASLMFPGSFIDKMITVFDEFRMP